jgi:phosphoenolpyruvate-protein kinase (PTS system EI component)
LLLGIGIQEFSMSLSSIGPIKRLIRRMRMHEAEELVQAALRCSTAGEVRKRCEQYVRSVAPDALGE